jgi:ABC-type Mn2+/Zn2+ transport system ATPase subunit
MTNTTDFNDVLALPNGASFVRGDLHIHTVVGSHDVTDPAATPVNIVQTAIDNGLSVIAIADHNEISAVEAAIDTARGKPVLVVPAVELSTMQGHLLCYLPDLRSLQQFHAQLTVRDSGNPNSRVENAMIDCLNRLQGHGGFALLAHVDGPKGLEREMPGAAPHKLDILSHPSLLGIELKNAASDISYTPKDPDNVRAGIGRDREGRIGSTSSNLARVLNSDSHTLAALGRNAAGDQRVTRYKLQTLSFEALKLALSDAEARVRLEDEVPRSVPIITGIRFKGGFIKDQAIHFSKNLTCIIGGRGTGKSTTFEGVRAFSKYPSGNSVVNSDVWPDRIDVVFRDEAGAGHQLAWSKGDVCATNVGDPIEGPDTIPIECYGQGETQKISQKAQEDPGALLGYLDRFVEVNVELANEEASRAQLFQIDAKISEARTKVALIPINERELGIVRQQIKKFTEGNAKELIRLSRQVEAERQSRAHVVEQARQISSSLDYQAVKDALVALKGAADVSTLVVGKDEFSAIQTLAEEFEKGLAASEGDLRAKSDHLAEVVRVKVNEWTVKEKSLLASIDQQKATLEAQGVVVDVTYITKLTKDEASYVQNISNLKTWEPHLSGLEVKRDELIAARWVARRAVFAKRKSFASSATDKLRKALVDLNVSLKFEENALSPQGHDLILELTGWRTNQVPRAERLTRHLTIPKLIAAVRANDPAPIQSISTPEGVSMFSKGEAQIILDRFRDPDALARLESVQVFDRPRLTVTRVTTDESGTVKPIIREFGQLSLGQQQSVLLALMLSSENPNPLLIDQPEDNLDSEFIYSQLVPVIRMAKERRQIIIVTHNPNIAVLGDAEQIIVLKANNEKALIVGRGSIDHHDTKEMACAVLEGAKAAFTRRGKIYNL